MIKYFKLGCFSIIIFLCWLSLAFSNTSECALINNMFSAILLVIFISVPIFVRIIEWNEKVREKRLGYRVDFHSPNVLRDGPDDFAIVYYQDGKEIWFYGKIINNEYILNLDIPEGEGYKEEGPKGINRKVMKSRILNEIKKFKHMKLKE